MANTHESHSIKHSKAMQNIGTLTPPDSYTAPTATRNQVELFAAIIIANLNTRP
jgi:hypothetical protein